MDFAFVNSPSQSPNPTIFAAGQYFDSTSEGSSPDSPTMLFTQAPMPFDMFQYGPPAAFYPPPATAKIPVAYNTASSVDRADQRRRRSGSNSTSSKDKDAVGNMHMRRRAQNRASQRAFRERKERHVKGLEHQLEELHEKHQDLVQSYTRQADEVSKLNRRISELTAELDGLRAHQDQTFSEMLMPDKFDKFDAFSAHDVLYDGPDTYVDKSTVDLNSEFALHSFEDSL